MELFPRVELGTSSLPRKCSTTELKQQTFFCEFSRGHRWIRTTEVERQQIYSLPHLAALEYAQNHSGISLLFLSLLSDSNQRPRDYKSRALAN